MMTMIPILETDLGKLYQEDCLSFLRFLSDNSVDMAFADPPFNLGKEYSSRIDDSKSQEEYLEWCKSWLGEMIRVLKPGGSLFVWNLPRWNSLLTGFLSEHLKFRHWIAVDIKYSLPISGRLYPSHYSLLYYIKGSRPNVFHPDRLPIPCCPACGKELKDYGGYKDKMNPKGVNLSDVWTDIPPVRHSKYKKREANALSLKLMDRIVSMSTDPGSVVLDPFGGSGTTFAAAELTGRKWIGSELDCSPIIERFGSIADDRGHLGQIHATKNRLFTEETLQIRHKNGKPISSRYRLDQLHLLNCVCSACFEPQQRLFTSA